MGHASQVLAHHQCDFPSLVIIDGCFGRLDFLRRARFNFYKAQHILIPAYQVDFAPTPRRTEVPSHHDVPKLSQVEVSLFFAPSPDALPVRTLIREHTRG